jgi:hypothetical protein
MDAKTKALMVITKDEKIRSFLEKNDPKALDQCETALKKYFRRKRYARNFSGK